jgi:DNA-binding response OmpR family regulator
MTDPKVLVVDDDFATCTLIETILKLEGYQTASVNLIPNGDFIAILNSEKPDIVLLDYHLGSQDTIHFLKAARSNEDWSGIPIIMSSAIDYSKECLEAGAADFIVKPFDWQSVTDPIRSILSDSIFQEV